MNYKNGYKVVYELAANGERTFYASKSPIYPNRDEDGKIIDTKLTSFKDAEFAGKTIYEYKGEFYVSTGSLPAYDEDGVPADDKIGGFEALFVEEKVEDPTDEPVETPAPVEPEEPVETPDGGEDDDEVIEDEPEIEVPAGDEE